MLIHWDEWRIYASINNHHWFRQWLVAWSPLSHYLKQCWNIVSSTLENKFHSNFNQNSYIFIQENAFENVVCWMASISFRPQCVNLRLLQLWMAHCRTYITFRRKAARDKIEWLIFLKDKISVPRTTVYPKKYAHGFCFAVICCGYTLTDFPISIRFTSLALWQSNDCPSASKAPLINTSCEFIMNYCITTTKQSTTKPCAYFLGYTVPHWLT